MADMMRLDRLLVHHREVGGWSLARRSDHRDYGSHRQSVRRTVRLQRSTHDSHVEE